MENLFVVLLNLGSNNQAQHNGNRKEISDQKIPYASNGMSLLEKVAQKLPNGTHVNLFL